MRRLEPLVIRDFRPGVNNGFANSLLPDNVLRYAINMNSDNTTGRYGSLVSRYGIQPIGLNIDASVANASSIFGLFSPTSDAVIAAVDVSGGGGGYYTYYNGSPMGGWSNIGAVPFDWTKGKLRFEQYLGYTFACNGTFIKSWDGNTANNWGATNLTSAPVGWLIKQFQGRLYISGNQTDKSRVYFSKLPSGGSLPAWDTSVDFFDVAPDDGDQIVAILPKGNLLYIFKHRSIYTWDGSTLSLLANHLGAITQESIGVVRGDIYFLSRDYSKLKLYSIPEGSYPVDVSSPIMQWLDSVEIFSGFPHSISADTCLWTDDQNCYFTLGLQGRRGRGIDYLGKEIREDDEFYNTIVKYNIITETFNEYLIQSSGGSNLPIYSTKQIVADGSKLENRTLIAGTSSESTEGISRGLNVWLWDETDPATFENAIKPVVDYVCHPPAGTRLEYQPMWIYIQTKELEFGSRARKKQLNKFYVYGDGDYGSIGVQIRVDGKKWHDLGKLDDKVSEFEFSEHGNYFEIKLVGLINESSGYKGSPVRQFPFVFDGFEFPDVQIEDYET